MPPRSPRGRPAGTTVGMLLCRMMSVPETQHARAVDERPPARQAGGRCRREGRRAGGMAGRCGRAVRRRWQNGSARPRAPASGRRDALRFSHPPSTGLCIGLPTSGPGCVSSGLHLERAVCRVRKARSDASAAWCLLARWRLFLFFRRPGPDEASGNRRLDAPTSRRKWTVAGCSHWWERLRGRTACKQESTQAAGPHGNRPHGNRPRDRSCSTAGDTVSKTVDTHCTGLDPSCHGIDPAHRLL